MIFTKDLRSPLARCSDSSCRDYLGDIAGTLAISNADSLEEGFPQGCGCILSSFGSAGWIARLIFVKTRLKVVTLRLRHLSALLQCFLLVALSVLSPSHPQAIQRWVTMTTTYGHLPERPISGSLRLISIPASEPRASNDRGGTGDQALTIAQANNGPPTSSLPRCDCNGSLISNDAELTGVKETFSGHPHSLVGWQL